MDPVSHELPPVEATKGERLLGALSMVGLGLLALIVTVTVVSRWVGRSIIPDDVLLVQELMVAVILLPLGLVTAARQHISVEVFTARVSPRTLAVLSALGHGLGLLFALLLLAAGAKGFLGAWKTQDYYNGVLHIPMWIGQAVFVFAMVLFALRLAIMIVHDLRRLGAGKA
ncbi:TRAP transporter small permease [Caenispirillum bisanense]|uniref:TRAP transporter small permease protein n=1 Tax=Caenispirillum bisanense TaxID=414052 RepID=A0A286GV69_9PROT|nr:TRAP transporter small permease [Caenispirillum bisanense]SOD99467.1 TRAP-type C4-dicarboxylate transport system, small permease component [Caenispirillum bisanense]